MMINIKRAVTESRKVTFSYYRDGSLWYVTEFDELFSVPIDDIGNATFNKEEKAILLMHYMRKWNESLEKEQWEEVGGFYFLKRRRPRGIGC